MFRINYAAFERRMDDIGRRALPKAAAGYQNGVAFKAMSQMKSEATSWRTAACLSIC